MWRFILFLFCISLSGWIGTPRAGAWQNSPSIIDDRSPFAIELPEINTGVLTATSYTDIHLPPGSQITRLYLWVIQPYDQRFGYDIKATLNGKALATVAQRRSGKAGNYLDVDLRQHPSLQLTAGKNVVEIVGKEAESQLSYRCSFVLLPGTRQSPRPVPLPEKLDIRFEQAPAHSDAPVPNDDRTAPQLTLTAPAVAPDAAEAPFELRVAGYARDESGFVKSVSLNGQIIASASPPKEEKEKKKKKKENEPPPIPSGERKLEFDKTITVEPHTNALLLEARDLTGNRALAYIPIRRNLALANNTFGGRRYAVIIGVSQYQHNEGGLTNLTYADKDAEALHDFLRSEGGGAFKEEDIVCLTNQKATRGAVENGINSFLTKAGPNDLIYLFLAGHGAPDPYSREKLYFLLNDSKVTDLPSTALSMSRIGDFLKSKSKDFRVIAFFDTCHSAGINRQALPEAKPPKPSPAGQRNRGVGTGGPKPGNTPAPPGAPPAAIVAAQSPAAGFNFYDAGLFKEKGWTVISSSGMNELSQESSQWGGHGVFTWALLEGAKGKADANGDCRITSAELSNHIVTTVRGATKNAQTPQSLPGSNGELVIAAVPGCNPRK